MDETPVDHADALDELERRRELTAEYARYSRNAGGLGSVIGGVLCLVAFVLNAMVSPLPLPVRLILALTPLVWIVAKETFRGRFYQQFGVVEEVWTSRERREHRRRDTFVAGACLLVIGAVLWSTHLAPTLPTIGFLLIVLLTPLLSWLYLRSPEEFKVGIFLMCQAAVMLSGGHYGYGFLVVAVVFSVAAITTGLHQHRDFLRIARELSSLRPLE